MVPKLFLHGVPDSPAIWRPLMQRLELSEGEVITPALPGFDAPLPAGFSPDKDCYVRWLISQLDALHARHGPVDVVGHDWGALMVQRAAMVRPDLIRSWIVCNAVIDPDYRGHRVARIWNRPIFGEIFMMVSRPRQIAATLAGQGVPHDIADEEGRLWRLPDKRAAILALYRSAKGLSFAHDWAIGTDAIPKPGLLIWGENDPYVPLAVAQRYSRRTNTQLEVIADAGHWAIAEKSAEVSRAIQKFWSSLQ
jgi:pimeloyl-ACP methyl ester carboxylesterase